MSSEPSHTCEFVVMRYEAPGKPPVNIGVLLYDAREEGALYIRFPDVWHGVDRDDVEYLSSLGAYLQDLATDRGPLQLLEWLESTISNILTVSQRTPIVCTDPVATIQQLFHRHVQEQQNVITNLSQG